MLQKFCEINSVSRMQEVLLSSDIHAKDPETLKDQIHSVSAIHLIKQNPKRRVYVMDRPDGSKLFLKLFAQQPLLSRIFRFYPQKEYLAAMNLEKLNLPVIRYLGWGHLSFGGYCISEGVPDSFSVRQYFFETLVHHPEQQSDFLLKLTNLICKMAEQKIHHPDFHIGNILYSLSEEKLYLPDPWGICQKKTFQRIDLCTPFLELRENISEQELIHAIQFAGLANDETQALQLFHEALSFRIKKTEHDYEKLKNRILSGHSKFATEIELPEGKCSFRHTPWYAPPSSFELDPSWKKQTFTSIQGSEKIWVDSFIFTPAMKNPPLARILYPDGSSALFYADV